MARIKKIKEGAKVCELDEICFPVELHSNPRKTNKEYSMVVTGVINGEEMDLNYCSNVYALIKNENIFPEIEQVLFNNTIDFNVEYKHINHVRFYADFQITDERYAYHIKGTNDKIMPQIRVQHSYNGLTKYKIVFGYFRLVCSNGMVIAVQEMNDFNLSIVGKHTDVVLHSFDKLNDMLRMFANNAQEITNKITSRYELLAEKTVNDPKLRITEILKANKIIAVDNAKINTVENILNRIIDEAKDENLGYNGNINDFLIYNGINQYLNDDEINVKMPEVRQELDSNVFEWMLVN